MNVSPIHIRVTQAERKLFEVAAEKTGLSISKLIKKAVMAYVRSPLPKDEIAEALEHGAVWTRKAAFSFLGICGRSQNPEFG